MIASAARREETKGRNRNQNRGNTNHGEPMRAMSERLYDTEEHKNLFTEEPAEEPVSESEQNLSDSESILTLYLTQYENQNEENPDEEPDPGDNPDEPEAEFAEIPFCAPPTRAMTAPARPRTEIEKFRASSAFVCLENAAVYAVQLVQKGDNKIDLDTNEGQKNCKRLLSQIESLCECFKVSFSSRKYRDNFSRAYKVLYKEGSLCYLTEILDSAQESKSHAAG